VRDKLKILDCTLRDGGYINDWRFNKKTAREVYRSLSKSGVDVVEIGFRGSEKYFNKNKYGLWRFSKDDVIREVTNGIKGAKLAVMGDFGKIGIDDFLEAELTPVDIVRLAVHKNNLKPCVLLLEKIKKKGYQTSLNAMGYASYTLQERKDLASLVNESNLDFLYVADSYGSMLPDQVALLFEPMLEISTAKLGFHPHNNLQMAFANTLEAIKCGVHIIDCTLHGIGRAAGNLPTEVLILYLELSKRGKYNVIPVLNCVDTYFSPLRKEADWGYQLPYMLSGMYKCHPNYAKNLIRLRQYNIEDISKAMEEINKINPVGFSQQVIDDVISQGIIGKWQFDSTQSRPKDPPAIPYLNRHKDKDFLVLANGPSLKACKDKIDAFIEKFDPIVIGANNLSELFKPDYHAFNNKRRFAMYADSVSEESILMISQHFDDQFVSEYTKRHCEKIYYRDRLDLDFDIQDGVIQSNCRTISVLLLGLAVAMGAERVFAAGLDGYVGTAHTGTHFYNEVASVSDEDVLVELHHLCERFIAQIDQYLVAKGKEGIHILTPTDYKSFYKGIENYI